MAENLLVLCPGNSDTTPEDIPALSSALREAGFIGAPTVFENEEHYRPGDDFLALVTFLGCSPVIAMGEPGVTGEGFCHIAFDGPLEQPRFVAGDNLKIPRCPGCGHRFAEWQALTAEWQLQPTTHFDCPDCGRTLNATQLRWRKSAGFGRFFIKIWGIFESEAVPNPNLLSILEKSTGAPWQHFYIRQQ